MTRIKLESIVDLGVKRLNAKLRRLGTTINNESLFKIALLYQENASILENICRLSMRPTPSRFMEFVKELPDIELELKKFPSERFFGYFYRHPWRCGVIVIGVNINHSTTQRQLTLGHILGHFIEEPLMVGHPGRIIAELASSSQFYQSEIKANKFAEELFVPRHIILKTLKSDNMLTIKSLIDTLSNFLEVPFSLVKARLGSAGITPILS